MELAFTRTIEYTSTHMKVALVLPTAMGVSSEEGRVLQFVNGFKQIAEIAGKYPVFDVFVVDNTISDISQLDSRVTQIIDTIPNLKEKIFFYDNSYGKKNKGAGLIIAWNKALERISDSYEYVVSFEPRQELEDFSFFERFAESPAVYIRITRKKVKKFRIFPKTVTQMWTGLVVLSLSDMRKYCAQTNLDLFVATRTSIEDDLYRFILKNHISFTEIDRLGILWHDVASKRYLSI